MEINKDPFIRYCTQNMLNNLKKKYLRYIVQNSSAVPIKNLKDILKLNERTILDTIIGDIRMNVLDVKIDLIEYIVYSNAKDELESTLGKTIKCVRKEIIHNYNMLSPYENYNFYFFNNLGLLILPKSIEILCLQIK